MSQRRRNDEAMQLVTLKQHSRRLWDLNRKAREHYNALAIKDSEAGSVRRRRVERLNLVWAQTLTRLERALAKERRRADGPPLAEVNIPERYIRLASEWHSGQDDLLYAVSSTGGLTLGSIRPYSDDVNRYLTHREWHVHLWSCLGSDIRAAARCAERRHDVKSMQRAARRLRRFESYAERVETRLREVYQFTESEAV